MDKERIQIKAKLLSFLVFVDDKDKQTRILSLLEEYESKIPDSKIHDRIQKLKRKNKSYEELVDLYVDDLLDHKLINKYRNVISELFDKLTPIVKDEPKNWWERFIEWFKKGTGIK